jgi:hypothetical protein
MVAAPPRPVTCLLGHRVGDGLVSDIESEYSDYESAKDSEGGLHPGWRPPSWRLLGTVALVLVALIGGIIALALIPGR